MTINNFIDYLACEAIQQLNAKEFDKWIKKCYYKNYKIAETAKALALEIPEKRIKKSKGALFTFFFKKYIKNKKA